MKYESSISRHPESGVTLVEILVVLALVSVMTGAVALGLGSVGRENSVTQEAQLLVARLNRAADETILTATPMQFTWADDTYQFAIMSDGAWVSHPVAVLSAPHVLPRGLKIRSADDATSVIVDENLLPDNGKGLDLRMSSDRGPDVTVLFNGVTASLLDVEG